ncbi:MAG: hypothetical protein ACFE9S_19255 [Candidatus Hermodarchaeota archaeon]
MIEREKISPLVIVGIGIIILSTLGIIFFSLPLIAQEGETILLAPGPMIPLLGLPAGVIILILGIYFSLSHNRSKGIFLLSLGIVSLILEIYFTVFIVRGPYPPMVLYFGVTIFLIWKGIKLIISSSVSRKKLEEYPEV